MFGTKTVRRDLLGLIIFSVVSLCAVTGIFALKMNIDARGNAELMSNSALAQSINLIETQFLRARRAEKDFLLRKDEKYLQRHSGVVDALLEEIDLLEAGLNEHAADQEDQNIAALREALKQYTSHFRLLSELNVSLGLTPDSGLEGELRAAVHQIEEALNELGIAEMQVKMLMMRRHEKDFIMRVNQKYVDRLNARVVEFREFPASFYPSAEVRASVFALLDTYKKAFNSFAQKTFDERGARKSVSGSFAQAEPAFDAIRSDAERHMAEDLQIVAKTGRMVLIGSALAVLITIGVFVQSILTIARRISKPLQQTAEAIEGLSTGKLDVEPPQSSYGEITQIADAFHVFRQNIHDSRKLEQESRDRDQRDRERNEEETRKAREREQERTAQEQRAQDELRAREQRAASEIALVVAACAEGDFSQRLTTSEKDGVFAELCRGVNQIGEVTDSGLKQISAALVALSNGDLAYRMNGVFSGVFEDIRQTMNSTTESLADMVAQIDESSETIGASSREIASAANNLAGRTERNAVTLEETAAAIEELSASVNSAAGVASEANDAVSRIKSEAENSGTLVDRTVDAMHQIQTSSASIGKVVDLIDNIAFQTNLLALNAGVEAARAGDAGLGFAVVASEVRGLAARSAEAAKEISAFIEESKQQVGQGVLLVEENRTALQAISQGVSGIAERIEEIATSAREQSVSIGEINSAASNLDRSTQQNAAMFEETTASSQILTQETENLAAAIAAFKISESTSAGRTDNTTDPGKGWVSTGTIIDETESGALMSAVR